MATIINNPSSTERVTSERMIPVESDSGGWAVAIIVLLLVAGAFLLYWLNYREVPATTQPATSDTTINLSLPENKTPSVPGNVTPQPAQ
jgi:hypothetical protein